LHCLTPIADERTASTDVIERLRLTRVLHVVETLDRGAIETWLVRMLRRARDRGLELDWTFYCILGRPGGALEAEAIAQGARVIRSPVEMGEKYKFIMALRRQLARGRYDVLHCHHDLMSSVYLLASAGLPIRRRIVHVHNADEAVPTPSRLKKAIYRTPMRLVCLGMADRIVGISRHTLQTFLSGRSPRRGRDVVHYYGVDAQPFLAQPDRDAFREALGLAADDPILLFAGRMVPEKGPVFAAEVFAELVKICPSAACLFVGNGSLDTAVQAQVEALGLQSRVRRLGWRDDIADIMGCCDWFILPRPEQPMEGFGLAVVEAQLAGLRLLLSEGIADDPLLPGSSVRRLPLARGAPAWAAAAKALWEGAAPSKADALAELRRSPMDMDRALDGLIALHR
jgi:glycosyltransferase involved in cell wall biosynthesis